MTTAAITTQLNQVDFHFLWKLKKTNGCLSEQNKICKILTLYSIQKFNANVKELELQT